MYDPRPTLIHHFVGQVRSQPDVPCLFYRRGEEVVSHTWRDVARDVARYASALRQLQIDRGDRVATAAANRYEWVVVDLAILSVGAVHVPLHNSLTGPQMRFQIVDAEADLVIFGGDEQAGKVSAAEPLDDAISIASIDPLSQPFHTRPVPYLAELSVTLDDCDLAKWCETAEKAAGPEDLATILYTSGTTGDPKGVMLTHRNLATNAEAMVAGFHTLIDGKTPRDRRLNLLPLSHIFARTCDLYTWLVAGNELALAESPQTVVAECAVFNPTLINAVPYFYEKVMRRLTESGMADEPDLLPQVLGGKLRHACSGGAPLPDHVARFFVDRGVLLTQGYGLTETSPVITMNTPGVFKHGTVGRTLPDVDVRIADDGEIVTRGPNVMQGYWNRPAETATALVDGWFHTGDLGSFDDEGYLRITGRKKELIVTTGGKKVVPSVVEALLSADPLVKQIIVLGDGQKFLTALVLCDEERLTTVVNESGLNVEGAAVLQSQAVADLVADRLRPRLSSLSHYEQVQKVALLDREFSIQRDELTLTMKLRREQIAANFADVIERLYADAGQSHEA